MPINLYQKNSKNLLMNKIFYLLLLMTLLFSCFKKKEEILTPDVTNSDKIVDYIWKTYFYSHKGMPDPTVVSRETAFQFRSDGKLYFTQINPVFRDTLDYQFLNEKNIKLNMGKIKIDFIDDHNFDFTMTSNESSGQDFYKTDKQ